MRTDDIFRIGLKHIKSGFPCEDYAISGYLEDKEHYYMAISDGCSGSNGMTDVGARFWCLSYLRTLKSADVSELFFDEDFILKLFREFNKCSFLPTRYDETASLIMFLANKKKAQISIFGDGGYCIEKNNGDIVLVEFSWKNNKPYYPIFKLEEELRDVPTGVDKFREYNGFVMKKTTKTFRPTNMSLTNKTYKLIDDKVEAFNFEEVEFGYTQIFDKVNDDVYSVSLFSDGLWTIQNNKLNNIIKETMSFKNFDQKIKFGFLKKRLVPLFEQWSNDGSYPLDDFSMTSFIW